MRGVDADVQNQRVWIGVSPDDGRNQPLVLPLPVVHEVLKPVNARRTLIVDTPRRYFTAMVTPGWLCQVPMVTTTGTFVPGVTPAGTCALI